jgi:uncharacterized membrane protein YkoI
MHYLVSLLMLASLSLTSLAEDLSEELHLEAPQKPAFSSRKSTIADMKLSAAQAAAVAGQYHPGQVMNVTLDTGTTHYGVKILNNGHMKIVYVDAVNGTISALPN